MERHDLPCYNVEKAVALCRFAGRLGLPVILTMRVEDERMTYLLKQENPDPARIRNLTALCSETKFILSNCLTHQIDELLPLPENVWFDTAGFKGEFYLHTQQSIPKDRILFGSFAPLQAVSSAVLSIPEAMEQQIRYDNFRTFLK